MCGNAVCSSLLSKILALLGLCCVCLGVAAAVDGYGNNTLTAEKILSRKRRYVAFPDGSSLSAAICLTIGVIGNPNVNWLSWAVNWGVAYDLPNYAWAKENANGFANRTKAMSQRRSRRDLFEKIELAVENMGYDGKMCVERALCEGAKFGKHMPKRRGNMIEEIVKTIFTLPTEQVAYHEPAEHHHYDRVYRRSLHEVEDCSRVYPECHFSILEMALGKYAVTTTPSSLSHRSMVPFM